MTLAEGAAQVLQTLPEPALVLGTDARIGFANRAARARFGAGVETGADLAALGPDEQAADRLRLWLRRCSGSRTALPGALQLRGADGRVTRFRGFGAVMTPAGGETRARLLLRLVDREDDRFPLLGRKLDELNVEISRRRRAQLALEAAVRDRDVLLNELHHRVKNNIQMLVGMLGMSRRAAAWATDPQAVLAEASRRLAAVGTVHQMLYLGDNLRGVPGETFLQPVAGGVLASLGVPHGVSLLADPVEISNDAAVPLGLVLHELLVNAVKHGCPDGTSTDCIRISLRRLPEEMAELRVEDDGPGFTLDAATRTGATGLKLVLGLARQLNGELSVGPGAVGGTCVVLRFPAPADPPKE
ncbi:sensor histidine kinase [Roseococcus thiosulfatophilus]|uniref:sensor histidine kinase n=1 Tax=Roseococcus thiosulfatophilus TaxID=35813 RepID=UPI001A8E13A1|nr:sensor histidine kinase [Roseococcus thiosulfatophilus]